MSLFSFKIAPGVRIRLSSRGVRASVGPRAARLHIGGGRAGVSTGLGPVTLYQSVGGRRRRRRAQATTSAATIAARQRQLAQAAKAAQAQQLLAAFQAILTLHVPAPEPMLPPVAPEPAPIDEAGIRQRHAKEALQGIGIFKRAERSAAKQAAAVAADAEIAYIHAQARDDRARMQAHMDRRWRALWENQPHEVLGALSEAFEDNEAPAAAVGIDGAEVAIVVVVPGLDVVPERMPTTTQAGNLSLVKLSKSRRSEFYTLVVCGHLLATVREAFAVAPGVTSVRAAVIRLSDTDAYGRRGPECLLAARLARSAVHCVHWADANAARIVDEASTNLLMRRAGQAKALAPLDVSHEPELAAMLGSVDVEELAHAGG